MTEKAPKVYKAEFTAELLEFPDDGYDYEQHFTDRAQLPFEGTQFCTEVENLAELAKDPLFSGELEKPLSEFSEEEREVLRALQSGDERADDAVQSSEISDFVYDLVNAEAQVSNIEQYYWNPRQKHAVPLAAGEAAGAARLTEQNLKRLNEASTNAVGALRPRFALEAASNLGTSKRVLSSSEQHDSASMSELDLYSAGLVAEFEPHSEDAASAELLRATATETDTLRRATAAETDTLRAQKLAALKRASLEKTREMLGAMSDSAASSRSDVRSSAYSGAAA